MKLSCAGYTFNTYFREKGLSLEKYADVCADMGLDGIELTQYYFPETSPAYLNALKRHLLRRGLALAGTAIGGAFCLATAEERQQHVEFVKEWLDISARLGSPCLRVFAGETPEGQSEEDAFQWTVEGLKECAARAGEVGVMIGVENHGGLTGTAEGLIRILKAVASDWVGALLDFGNYSQEPYAEFEQTAPYTVMTHAKPTSDFAGSRDYVDYRRVADIMRRAGYRGFLSIEYEEPGQDAMVEVPRFAAYLRGVTG
ncbi:MAG: sugar phosphate isomerase/epimerase [Armatimonadota bacterium]|nr:MAG: sugar phosphate isomerase/epimerase [Armatimonadota bacterium]